jgi:molecular chaperone GrpE
MNSTQDPNHSAPANASTDGQTAETEVPQDGNTVSPEQQLAELKARHAEVSDAYLRAKAEAENIRRRSEEEVGKARKFAIESFA